MTSEQAGFLAALVFICAGLGQVILNTPWFNVVEGLHSLLLRNAVVVQMCAFFRDGRWQTIGTSLHIGVRHIPGDDVRKAQINWVFGGWGIEFGEDKIDDTVVLRISLCSAFVWAGLKPFRSYALFG